MAERNSFRSSSARFRVLPRTRRQRQMRAEEALWASKSGPVTIWHVDPASLVDRQEGYDQGTAAGGNGPDKPAA